MEKIEWCLCHPSRHTIIQKLCSFYDKKKEAYTLGSKTMHMLGNFLRFVMALVFCLSKRYLLRWAMWVATIQIWVFLYAHFSSYSFVEMTICFDQDAPSMGFMKIFGTRIRIHWHWLQNYDRIWIHCKPAGGWNKHLACLSNLKQRKMHIFLKPKAEQPAKMADVARLFLPLVTSFLTPLYPTTTRHQTLLSFSFF